MLTQEMRKALGANGLSEQACTPIMKVGPHGYIHGYIFVGVPDSHGAALKAGAKAIGSNRNALTSGAQGRLAGEASRAHNKAADELSQTAIRIRAQGHSGVANRYDKLGRMHRVLAQRWDTVHDKAGTAHPATDKEVPSAKDYKDLKGAEPKPPKEP